MDTWNKNIGNLEKEAEKPSFFAFVRVVKISLFTS